MRQHDDGFPNRAARKAAARQLKKAIKSGVGVSVKLAGVRVIAADGTVKYASGRVPEERP